MDVPTINSVIKDYSKSNAFPTIINPLELYFRRKGQGKDQTF